MVTAPPRCASPPMYLVRCRWWTPREYMSGPLACRAPEGPVCREVALRCAGGERE